MSSAFINNDASNGPALYTDKERAETMAATLAATTPENNFEVCPYKNGGWIIARQDKHGSFIEWVQE